MKQTLEGEELNSMSLAIFLISSLGITVILLQISLMLMDVAGNNISKLEIMQEYFMEEENEDRKTLKIKLIYQSIKTVLIIMLITLLMIVNLFILIGLPIISFMKIF